MRSSACAITRTFNETNFIGEGKLDASASQWNGMEGTNTSCLFAAIDLGCADDGYCGNGVARLGATFESALLWEIGETGKF